MRSDKAEAWRLNLEIEPIRLFLEFVVGESNLDELGTRGFGVNITKDPVDVSISCDIHKYEGQDSEDVK